MTSIVPIVPCSNLDRSEAFYTRLGFAVTHSHSDYRILYSAAGVELHLRQAAAEELHRTNNPCGVYVYADDVATLAIGFRKDMIGSLEDKPWGMYEFAVSDPDGALVRVGRFSIPGKVADA